MRKEFLFLLLLITVIMACGNNSPKVQLPAEISKHKLFGGAVLELPKSFEIVESKMNLEVRLQETNNVDADLLKTLGIDLKMNHQLFFDFTSGAKMMYLIVDHYGPRFELTEEMIAKQIALTERQMAEKYKGQNFKLEKIAHKLIEIDGSKFLKVKFKKTLNGQIIYRTVYTAMLKENRRSLTFTFDNYNEEEVDLDSFILAFT